ncbi:MULTISPECIES: AAA family ATPase [Stenotrophomonas]|uniref:AAA family ATPase n=1 Tax=Stenotrophomonas TaxID=40323 RepID=UPI000D53C525|nr:MULTISPECIES: AAA family ATPase [Stenotrophomonas]AWH21610.1 ATPase [Stenotrophomonas sp. ZAC14D2_NAIMI4_6]AWH29335.1 ATPase [Stenotrophomonas sp. YAU14A_MKIMI4_1]AWH33309.1 ATPase [Stenotrophomonas sp. SAU14A_NAIMI4_8]
MPPFNLFQRLSQAPTNPRAEPAPRSFDVAELYAGPVALPGDAAAAPLALDEKLRQAYFWIVNNAIISPHYDIEYHDGPSPRFNVGDSRRPLTLPSAQSYSSYVLLPLLTFATRRKCLFVGGPGRGKTASAILMGVLAGYPVREVRRAMQHGHPQMTIADLLGNPLPADLVAAQDMNQIRIAWRSWLSMRVKIIDEYNRIPTRTQSALLTVMGDNYAEILNHVYECPESAWYLTANDDRGGGTYQVIEALRDRIDVVVQALAFNPRFLEEMLLRIEQDIRPEEVVPRDIIFTEAEGDQLLQEIRAVEVPQDVRRRIEFFSSQFELMETAGAQFEYMTKDTARLAGADWAQLTAADSGRDRMKDLGCQTRNGLSVRNLMTLLMFAKAMAYFRGNTTVALDDVRQVLPFVLNDKLQPDPDAPFFALPENAAYRSDHLGWLRWLFDASTAEYDRLDLDRDDPVGALSEQFAQGLDGLGEGETRKRLTRIERLVEERVKGRKLYGHLYDDLLKLKYLHQRYTNYLHWLRAR